MRSRHCIVCEPVPQRVVQERLGHSTIVTMSDIFPHVMREMDVVAAEAFEKKFDDVGARKRKSDLE